MIPEFAARIFRMRCEKGDRCWRAVSVLLMFALPIAPETANAQTGSAADSGQAGSLQRPIEPEMANAKTGSADNPEQAGALPRPNWLITPFVSVEGTYTDNVALAENKKSDFITQLSPGIRFDGKSARASVNLNYQWQRYDYAQNSGLGNQQRSMLAKGKLELVEQWLFLEGSQNISQQYASAFGVRNIGNELVNANRTETKAYSVSPYIKGRLANVVDYQLRYSGTRTRSDSGALSGGDAATTGAWIGQLSGGTRLAHLSWSFDVNSQVVHNTNGFDSNYDRASGTLTYQIDPQVRMHARAGHESDNFINAVDQKRTTGGLGLDWAPTARTSVSLDSGRDAGGSTYSVDFNHRTALSAWKFSDSRGVVVPTSQMAQIQSGTAYDLLYQQLASSIPDPTARADETNLQLAQVGIPANSPIFGPLQTSQPYVETRQRASVALIGANNTVIVAVDRSDRERLGPGIGLVGDFALNENIRQSGFNASWAYKMTPHATLTLNASAARNTGSANLETTLKAWSLLLTTQLGAKTSASLGLRQNRFSSTSAPGYDELALTGAMLFKF